MPSLRDCAVCVSVSLVLAGCGAGGTQNKGVPDEETMALWPMTTASAQARQEVTDGIREWDAERYVEAYQHFQRAIAADSTFATAQLWAALDAQVPGANVQHIARAVALSNRANELERLLIQSVQKNYAGDDQGARDIAAQVVAKSRDNPRSWLLLAQSDSILGNVVQQRADLDSAVAHGAGFAPAYIALSTSYVLNEPYDYARGEQMARKAVALVPDEAAVYQKLGNALRAQGKLEEAAQAYTKQAELDPTKGLGLQQRAHVNAFMGHFVEARADYDAAVATETDAGNQFGYAIFRPNVFLFEGNARGAIAELDSLSRFVDDRKVPAPDQAKLGLAMSRFSIAVHYQLIPEAARAYADMASFGEQLAKRIGTETFRRRWQAELALEAGYLAWARKDYAAAERHAAEFSRLVASDRAITKDQPAHALRGLILLSQNRNADALAEFEQAPTGSSNLAGVNSLLDFIYAYYNRALALERLGRLAEARKYYQKIADYHFNTIDNALIHNAAAAKLKQLPVT